MPIANEGTNLIITVEDTIQRNTKVKNWIDNLESPIEQAGAWKLFRFLCEYYPKLRGETIFHSIEEG